MDSTRNVNVEDDEVENIKDNGQLTHDNGSSEATDDNRPKSLIMEIYPWLQQFRKMCKSSIMQRSMESLKNLMMFYSRHVRPSVNECHTKPLRADKLKDSMSETLLFFLYYYREIGKDQDRASYMDVMSDLLAMYIDMELKASKKGNEHHSKISARLSSCLHVYLDYSAEYLLDTLLKIHFMTCNYQEILDPVITKIFKGIQEHPISSIMYVRYLLAYRLWKKLNKDVAVRNQINVTALSSLGTAPAEFHPFVIEYVLPKVPKNQKLTTKLLLLQKFEVEKSCEEFLNFCKRERGLDVPTGKEGETSPTDTVASTVPEDNDSRELIVNDSNVENLSTEPEVSSSSANLLIKKSHNNENVTNSKIASVAESTSKLSSRRRAKKSNDIVFIDLTSDSVTERVIRRKKTRSKLSWFKEAKKRFSVKTAEKKNATLKDESTSAEQLEDKLDLLSLRVCSPASQVEDALVSGVEEIAIGSGEATFEEQTSPQSSVKIDETSTTERTSSQAADYLANRGESYEDVVEEAATISEKTPTEEPSSVCERLVASVSESPASDTRSTESDNCGAVEHSTNNSSVNKIDDERESAVQQEKYQNPEACPASIGVSIKAEDVSEEPYEVANEEVVTSAVELPVAEYASEVSLRTSLDEPADDTTVCETKIREVEFQDNIDGLSLLASVSQSVSHLTTKPTIVNGSSIANGELIKVKTYASLANLDAADEPVTSTDASPFDGDPSPALINRIVGIYPEDEMDKVAFEVEVTSTGEMNPYEDCDQVNVGPFLPNTDDSYCNSRLQNANVVPIPEIAAPVEKDDTKVILNGETVVLFQKSPNSNLYIINKAVENRDHVGEDVTSGLRDMTEHSVEAGSYPYELYDSLYRGQPTSYDITQYSRELSNQEARRVKKVTVDNVGETNKPSDSIELGKNGKKKNLSIDVIGKASPGKRKNSGNSNISRRCRIKQEYNGCANNLSAHMNPTYGIQDCSQERVESSRSIHMPVAHGSPLSSIYTKYPAGAELYLPCRKSCNSMTCGLPVNSSTGLHQKSTASSKSRCSCLDCTYDIVAHCTECIMPSGENLSSTVDNASYYLPIHSTVQNSAVQDCGRQSVDESRVNIYDEQLVCKFEKTILEGKTLSGVGVKCEPEPIYRAKLDNKLPLKKRFKAMMSVSFDEMTIKRERVQSYPSTPMLSIAAFEAQNALRSSEEVNGNGDKSLDISAKYRGEMHGAHYSTDVIRRDCRKEPTIMSPPQTTSIQTTNSNCTGERKRKRRSAPDTSSCNVDEANYQRMLKTPAKHKQTAATGAAISKRLTSPTKSHARPSEKVRELDVAPTKNSTRQTRSSKRNVPKVNYIYADGDSDWNPSDGGSKRKRKKTSR